MKYLSPLLLAYEDHLNAKDKLLKSSEVSLFVPVWEGESLGPFTYFCFYLQELNNSSRIMSALFCDIQILER